MNATSMARPCADSFAKREHPLSTQQVKILQKLQTVNKRLLVHVRPWSVGIDALTEDVIRLGEGPCNNTATTDGVVVNPHDVIKWLQSTKGTFCCDGGDRVCLEGVLGDAEDGADHSGHVARNKGGGRDAIVSSGVVVVPRSETRISLTCRTVLKTRKNPLGNMLFGKR